MTDRVTYVLPRVDCRFRGDLVRTAVADFRADFQPDPLRGGRVMVVIDLDAALARRAAGQDVDEPPESWRFDVREESHAKTFWVAQQRGFPIQFVVRVERTGLAVHEIVVREVSMTWDTTPGRERPILTIDVDRFLAGVSSSEAEA